MTDRRKNLLVGGTVLLGLCILGWMVLQFGGMALNPFTNGRASVTILTERADGLGVGSPVLYRGMGVGQVRKVRLADDLTSVVLEIQLNKEARVPANVQAIIRPQGLLGGNSAIYLELTSTQAEGRLMAGAELRGRIGSLELMPSEFTILAEDLRKTSQSFRESGVMKHLDEAIVTISKQANKAGEMIDGINKLVGDEATRRNIQESLANINEATGTARRISLKIEKFSSNLERTGEGLDRMTTEANEAVRDARATIKTTQTNIDQITRQIGERLTQSAGLLESISSVARKVDQGKGTAGMMVNDPKLYEAMVDSAKQLNATIADLKRLVEQWEQEGITFRVN